MNIKIKSAHDMETGKSHEFFRPILAMTGLALCMSLVSCVVPYDSSGGGSVTVTSYSPGYRVSSLPRGYRSEIIAGTTYYYYDGYYYQPRFGGYVIVEAPRHSRYYGEYSHHHRAEHGEVITRLPHDYRVLNHRGNTYYQAGGRYYRRQNGGYVIVTRPY